MAERCGLGPPLGLTGTEKAITIEPGLGWEFSAVAGVRPSLSPAAQLILLTAAVRSRAATIRRLVSAGIDWEEMCGLAQNEKAASIVLRELGPVGSAVSDPGYQELRQLAKASVMQLLQLEQLLHRTTDSLAERGIEVMLLKGAGLGYTAYASFADRPMGDLDIMVRPQDAEPAWRLLQARGWTWPSARWPAGCYQAHQHLPPLLYQPGAFRLELHADVLPEGHPFRFSADTLWARVQRVRLGHRVLTVPHLLHQLWHVCVHFAWSHELQWGAWRALRDCAAIVQRGPVDWAEFVDLARESRAGTCCFWTLRLARRLADAAVPQQVLTALRPPRAEFWLQRLERHYVSSLFPSRDRCPSIWLSRRLWEAGMLPAWSGHGQARPWHVGERWRAGLEPEQQSDERPRPLWSRLGNAAAWVAYLRRIQRFALPVHS